ncbi:MAG TPA: mechanosensitive ion channel domain-containing protein [Gallionella sp.]|nr:mechanosensitive ion channel domain-containing protein [Gallionella sp.]
MSVWLEMYHKLKDAATVPWFSIADTQINLVRLVGLLVILTLVWRIGVMIEKVITRLGREKEEAISPGWYALSRMSRYAIWIIGFVVGLNYIGFDMASFAVIGGAIGVGVGFGLQNIISNFVSGIIILIEEIVKVDDFVDLQSGVMGKVTEINLRYTRVTTSDLIDIIVPNSEFITGRVVNWTLGERSRRIHVPFGVAYGVDKDLVREAGIAAAANITGTVHEPGREPDVWLVGFGDSSLNFELVVWVGPSTITSPGKTQAVFLWAIEDELRKRNIEIPFPQRDLHIRSGTLAVRLDKAS